MDAANRNVAATDVVVWYTFGHTHIPRVEDWPVMPVNSIGFLIRPDGFFAANPALDLAPNLSDSRAGEDRPKERSVPFKGTISPMSIRPQESILLSATWPGGEIIWIIAPPAAYRPRNRPAQLLYQELPKPCRRRDSETPMKISPYGGL